MAALQPGARLSGDRFAIERTLGSGGMGVVYAAHDHHRGCAVAVKTSLAPTLDALHRLRDEFLVLHDLAHPNLVLLGELVDGVGFLDHMRPGGTLDVAVKSICIHATAWIVRTAVPQQADQRPARTPNGGVSSCRNDRAP